MAWSRAAARARMMDSYEQMDDIDLRPLVREMDLENLGLSQARTVTGVHVYLDVANFQSLLEARRENTAELKKLLRHLTVFQRQVERLFRQQDGAAVRVHFQGARLHFIVFKPYDTEEGATLTRLVKAVTLVGQMRQLADLIQVHTDIHFEFEAGVDTGEAIATMNARAKRRQLLFVGRPANEAAKALTGKPSDPGEERLAAGAAPFAKQLPSAAAREKLPTSFEADVEEDIEAHPLESLDITDVRAPIDYGALGKKVARLEEAITFFGDLSGFTSYVASLSTEDEKKEALRLLHVLRSEMQAVVADYDGDFIQFQGDRVQALLYEARTSGRFKSKAVETAAALCSAVDLAKELFPALATLDVSCGADVGKILVGRVGLRDDKEVTVLGRSIPCASELQDGAGDGHTAISVRLWEGIEKSLQGFFSLKKERYVADFDLERIEAEEAAKAYDSGGRVVVGGTLSDGLRVTPTATGGIRPARSWGE
ncbi:hypothetical protein [Myxococcus sp. AM010]|uniref:hypothetical protein n=1 Tax=Myxococcus sp. AM010 TaxID=2745138 RepID=UPI0020D02AF7|nr:hypothetical protein [Myxococcus sp. AM010]